MNFELPIIGIPIGDIAGIGPEIAVKAAASTDILNLANPILIGPANIIRKEAERNGISYDELYVENTGDFNDSYKYGSIQAACGLAAYQAIERASAMAMSCHVDAIATTPINKESIRAANIHTIGHTEILADLSGTKDSVTLFQTNELLVFFLSRHLSLADACRYITEEHVYNGIVRTYHAMKLLDMTQESMPFAVAGLNPHNGEHGLFGREEELAIEPAIERARREGIPVTGPIPADSVFYQARTGKFSAVLSLYHDQGHIATKTYDFERTISLTLGMPYLRTSVDHGTAFDIAGQGIAQTVSMVEAIRSAAKLAISYRKNYNQYPL